MILDVITFVEAKKTLDKAEDIAFTAEGIIDAFPTLKLEELKLCTNRMKLGYYGKYYERLKAAEFIEAIQKHEVERAEYLEQKHKKTLAAIEVETSAINSKVYSFRKLADELNLPQKSARTMRDFMRQGALLTQDELQAIEDVHKKEPKG